MQYHTGSMTRRVKGINELDPRNLVWISPKDAEGLGIADGDLAGVATRRGEIEVQAKVTTRMPDGVIFLPFHYSEAPANALTVDVIDPVSKIPELKVGAARVTLKEKRGDGRGGRGGPGARGAGAGRGRGVTMRQELAKAIRETLDGGRASAVLFLTETGDGLLPHLAKDASDAKIDEAYTGDFRFPMAGFAAITLPEMEGTLAVVARECDRRMMNELSKFNHLDLERLLVLGIPCSQELADACMCDHPAPADAVFDSGVKPVEAVEGQVIAEGEEEVSRLDYWMEHFNRCIRCYGCRNVCPLCFCKECAMEKENLAGTDLYPPDIPIFHIIRALDMADRCIDCGMCEISCPADIPLRSLYRQMCGLFTESFGYQPGLSAEEKSPLTFLGEPADFGAHE